MSKALSAAFDYGLVDKESGGKLKYLAGEIRKTSKQHKESGLVVGKAVCDAHELLAKAGKEGQFTAWVEAECRFSRATAYNYMNAYERFGECDVIDQFDQGALYVLASPSVPEEAFKEAVKNAKKGQHYNSESAKEVVGKFKALVQKTAPNKVVKGPIVQPLDDSTPVREPTAAPAEPVKTEADQPADPPVEPVKISGGTTFDVDEIEAADTTKPLREKFKKLIEHLRLSILLLDEINNDSGRKHSKTNEHCHETINILWEDVHAWRKAACK